LSRVILGALILFGFAYLIALVVAAAGTVGLFGIEKDPLSGVFLIPLGFP